MIKDLFSSISLIYYKSLLLNSYGVKMYLHIVPRFYNYLQNKVKVVSVEIPELNFKLDETELSVGRPFPNKYIHVVMKKGRMAKNGFLIKTSEKIKSFTVITLWKLEGYGITRHSVVNYVDDDQYDMVSQCSMLCQGFTPSTNENDVLAWANRIHPSYAGHAPAVIDVRMEALQQRERDLASDILKSYQWGDLIIAREESYLSLTIPSQRLINDFKISYFDRLPQKEDAFNL